MGTCATCGTPNPNGARFCNACGAPLAPSPGGEVRKTVTILFADVTGSTALGEQLDPEAFRRVMARYFELARGTIERHGGTVEKFIGDAVMAVFGVPSVHEDDALRAVRAATEVRRALETLNKELDRDYGVSLRLRTGINTGEVVTGTEERLATGDAVNVAARLEQAAEPGEILIGEGTRRLTIDAIDVEPVEPLTLKGKADPVPAHRLLHVREDAPAFRRRLDAPLVGRRDELAALRSAFAAAVEARDCRLTTVLGPPGIGKSRLARELASALADEADVLTGRCLPYGEGITYWPLVEIFREADAEAELAEALAPGAPDEISWSVRKALERRGRERPVVLLVEDIHWAEPTLLDLLEHLVDWTRDAPVLLACMSRPDLLDERPAWGAQPRATTVRLEPLSAAESEELIDEHLARAELSSSARQRISDVAEGNPLFVEQLLASVADGGDPERVPETIQALLAARLDALPSEEREVLERAAVVGLEFEWAALGELAADGRRPGGAQLAALVRKELIRPHELIEDTFQFRHILIRDAAYERIPKELRSVFHERFAGWLDGRTEELDQVIGYHLEQAYRCLIGLGPGGERARALADAAADRLGGAGQGAFGRGDIPAAVSLLERAADLLQPDDSRRLRLLPILGRVYREYARLDDAEAILVEAVERGSAAGERAVAADAGVALADLRFHRPTRVRVGREEVLGEIDTAIQVFEEVGDTAGLARALALRGRLRLWGGEAEAALQDLERSGEHAREAGDSAQEAESLRYTAIVLRVGPAPIDESHDRLLDLERRVATNRRLEIALLGVRARFEAMEGRFDVARQLLAQADALAETHGLHASLDFGAGEVELLAGDPVAAEKELRPLCERLEEIGELGFLASVAPLLGDALYRQERFEEALELTERWPAERLTVPEDVDGQAGWRRVRAKVLARMGRLAEAEGLGREAVAMLAATDFTEARAQAAADLGVVLHIAGRDLESAAAFAEAIQLYEQKGNRVAAERLRTGLTEPTASTG